MFIFNDVVEKNEVSDVCNETEKMDSEFEDEVDNKVEKYTNDKRSLEEIKHDKEVLLQMKEKLQNIKDSQETDDEDGDSEKVLVLRRHR